MNRSKDTDSDSIVAAYIDADADDTANHGKASRWTNEHKGRY